MKDWLHANPNGSKDAFEKYFKGLPAPAKKVCDQYFPSLLTLILLCTQIFKDQANAAVRISAFCA
jgi:hypothetical protein